MTGRKPTLARDAHQAGDAERREQRQGAELGRRGEADGDAGEDVVARPAALHDADQEVERQRDQERQEDVRGHVVRVLHVQHAGGEQEAGQQADRAVVEPRAEEDEQDHGQRADRRR